MACRFIDYTEIIICYFQDTDVSDSKTTNVVMVTEEWKEVEMVKSFLDSCIKNCGLLDMCCTFLHVMARHYKVQW